MSSSFHAPSSRWMWILLGALQGTTLLFSFGCAFFASGMTRVMLRAVPDQRYWPWFVELAAWISRHAFWIFDVVVLIFHVLVVVAGLRARLSATTTISLFGAAAVAELALSGFTAIWTVCSAIALIHG